MDLGFKKMEPCIFQTFWPKKKKKSAEAFFIKLFPFLSPFLGSSPGVWLEAAREWGSGCVSGLSPGNQREMQALSDSGWRRQSAGGDG